MEKIRFSVGSVTTAMRGRDLLRKHGFSVRMEHHTSAAGCGYSLVVGREADRAEALLQHAGIRILERTGMTE